jgi:hypothetical protein
MILPKICKEMPRRHPNKKGLVVAYSDHNEPLLSWDEHKAQWLEENPIPENWYVEAERHYRAYYNPSNWNTRQAIQEARQ